MRLPHAAEQTIYPVKALGVDVNRTLVNTSVSRYGLAALVMEACRIYGLNNRGSRVRSGACRKATGRRG